jgi:hypothetical protein
LQIGHGPRGILALFKVLCELCRDGTGLDPIPGLEPHTNMLVELDAWRMHEVGMITSSPQQIIAEGTDWRFFNALQKELKG